MAQGKKTSSDKIQEVIIAKVGNPDLSTRDLQKKTGVNRETARTIIKEELPWVVSSSDTIAKLIDDNNKILNITGDELLKKLADENWQIRVDEFLKLRDLALKQNKLVEVTDPNSKARDITIQI